MKVLVVDDSESTLTIVSHFIEKNDDFEVIGFTDPMEVAASLDNLEFDIAVIDFLMPGMDGAALISEIQANPKFSGIPILMLTANDDRKTRLKALTSGAIDFITKPIEPVEFGTRMKNIGQLRAAQILLEDQARLLNTEVEKQTRKFREREQDIVDVVTRAANYRHAEGGNHALRVGKYAAELSRHLGLNNAFCKDIMVAAQMHDIGKVALPSQLLSEDEMKRHTETGAEILAGSASPMLQMASAIARHHHEMWNGEGYPAGLAQLEIPLEARIVAVADRFDCLSSTQPDSNAWPIEEVIEHLNKNAGSAFDPQVVRALEKALPQLLEIMDSHADEAVAGQPARSEGENAA